MSADEEEEEEGEGDRQETEGCLAPWTMETKGKWTMEANRMHRISINRDEENQLSAAKGESKSTEGLIEQTTRHRKRERKGEGQRDFSHILKNNKLLLSIIQILLLLFPKHLSFAEDRRDL